MTVVAAGQVVPEREGVRAALEANLTSGEDLGAAFCVMESGETTVDIWGGWADPARTRPWARDTIVNAFSTTKPMAAMAALWLVDQGHLDLSAPVARYWPAFAANGKGGVTVAQVLSHSAGLPDLDSPVLKEDLYDWEKMTDLLARQAPAWAPGTESGYHSITFGYLIGEVVRRITGRSIGTVFREVFAEPLGADFHIGLPQAEDHRVAVLLPPEDEAVALLIDVRDTATRAWRGAELPAIGGTGNARGLAQVLSILANGGGAQGRRFLSEAGCRRVLDVQIEGRDRVLGFPIRWGLGFAVSGGVMSFPNPNTAFWGGYGGSLAVVDFDAKTAMAYVMNKMAPGTGGDMRGLGLAMATWEAQGLL